MSDTRFTRGGHWEPCAQPIPLLWVLHLRPPPGQQPLLTSSQVDPEPQLPQPALLPSPLCSLARSTSQPTVPPSLQYSPARCVPLPPHIHSPQCLSMACRTGLALPSL